LTAFAFLVLAVVIGSVFALYALFGHAVSRGDFLLMPLDDTYIHFQYARMTAQGIFWRYNAVDPATSGATSLIYPFLLALGYKLGFTGTSLALWAIGIGGVAWWLSACLVFRLLIWANADRTVIAFLVTLAFALSGGLVWAALSGMETALIVCFTLYTLDRAVRRELTGTLLGGILCATIRPEGAIIALLAALYVILPRWKRLWLLVLPGLAMAIQPILNFLLTGTFTASGMQAKSILYNVPFDLQTAVLAILGNFGRMWVELLTGLDIDRVLYFIPILLLLGLLGGLFTRVRRPILLIWLVIAGNFAALAILETAFWQFKRYQQPVIALAFVALGWWLCTIRFRRLGFILGVVTLGVSVYTCATFATYYQNNVNEIASLQVPMARYVNSITTPNDRIAVHDIGVMAYIGDRHVYDVVGLVTNGAALAWRTGPGAMYEAMQSSPQRPTFMAIYDEPHGLSYFKNTALFKNTLQTFASTGAPHVVASASARQIVTKIDWSTANASAQTYQPIPAGFNRIDWVNVADLESERAHHYQFTPADLTGYASEPFEQTAFNSNVRFLDGGRRVSSETFTIQATPKLDLLWKIRVQPRSPCRIVLTVAGDVVQRLVQPGDLGGKWLEISALVPGWHIQQDHVTVKVEVEDGTGYEPFYHWFYQSAQPFKPDTEVQLPPLYRKFAYVDMSVILIGARAVREGNQLIVDTDWQLPTPDPVRKYDGKIFVHVYRDVNQPPVAQFDTRAGNGALPPANWLPGIVREHYVLTLPSATEDYKLAIGLYNPETNERYRIIENGSGDRVFIEITPR
jgi:hypothetical protein